MHAGAHCYTDESNVAAVVVTPADEVRQYVNACVEGDVVWPWCILQAAVLVDRQIEPIVSILVMCECLATNSAAQPTAVGKHGILCAFVG